MNNMTPEEMISLTKVLSVFMGSSSPTCVSNSEKTLAVEALKKLADKRNDWTQEQKYVYKALADIVKEQTKQF